MRSFFRTWWLRLHSWLALSVGLLLVLIGISGSLLMLKSPLLQWEIGQQALIAAPRQQPYADAEQWKLSAQQHYSQLKQIMGVAPPGSGFIPATNAMVFGKLQQRAGMGIAFIDPYDAQPRGFVVFDDLWFSHIVNLHRLLLLPAQWGGPLVALSGVVLLLSLISGLVLWWPKIRALKSSLILQRRSRGTLWWRQLHNISAIYLFFPLLLVTLTGIALAQPPWFAFIANPRAVKPLLSTLHSELLLGTAGKVLVFSSGLALPVLYCSGVMMWWRKRRARRLITRAKPSYLVMENTHESTDKTMS
ncbi:PepSY domain-containing protein [Yersinia kristensenii]|uniref:PepSY-associated TM helix domain-containing protein n=1 Tax=Yersinia kristensenii TaxID=28152 RepID=UPI001C610C9B|nr:PepSY-associated TM helix domain-containing protein [Yersinia kristensenii]MBW5825212.1 PepSY domain-containing protein [Yersinia kristensenii]